jgi:hypothetical protein
MHLLHWTRTGLRRSTRAKRLPRGGRLGVEPLERRDLLSVSITGLGSLDSLPLTPSGVNDQGQVVGFVQPSPTSPPIAGFLYTSGKGAVALQTDAANVQSVSAFAINDAGQIAGDYGDSTGVHAIFWSAGGTSPTTLPGQGPSLADAINVHGEVVGSANFSTNSIPNTGAALWTSSTAVPIDLGPGLARGINASGDVVGLAPGAQPGLYQPFVCPANGREMPLPLLAGYTAGAAFGINQAGTIVGEVSVGTSSNPEAVLWKKTSSAGYTVQDIGSFMPLAINDNGTVVGYSGGTGTGQPAVAQVWSQRTGLVTMQSLAGANSGWTFQTATAINDHNDIVGVGSHQGQQSTFGVNGIASLPHSREVTLSVHLDDAHIVPVLARDLHLSQLYGGEQVVVPVTVKNDGLNRATGIVRISLTLDTFFPIPTFVPWAVRTEAINLAPGQAVEFKFILTVPKQLSAGLKYTVEASMQSPNLNSSPSQDASTTQYDYVGAPSAGFSGAAYFQIIRDTLQGKSAAPVVNVNDLESFVAHWIGDSLWPYKNAQGVPMVGVGINLKTVSGQTRSYLAASVRGYYQQTYGMQLGDDNAVIAMLIAQARPLGAKQHAPQALSTGEDPSVFAVSSAPNVALATQDSGNAWFYLNAAEQIALIDTVYRQGAVPAAVDTALNASSTPDFVWAGFALVNSAGAPHSTAARLRVEAEYQDLLSASVGQLG